MYFAKITEILKLYSPFSWYLCCLLCILITLLITLVFQFVSKNKQKHKPCKKYIETYFEIECTQQTIRHLNDKNIDRIKGLGGYSNWLNDNSREVFCELQIIFKEPIVVIDYKIDVIKTFGKIENPYICHSFGSGENNLCCALILKIGNIDINNGRYKIQFLSK